jgi:hypothetical protein
MKIKALLGLLLFFPATGVFAREVTKSEAKIVALNWLNSHSEQIFDTKDISKIDILEENEDALIYLVSFSPKGWVMVSGVDKTEPVLGYSASSVFDVQKMPVQLKGWLDGLENELRKASSVDYLPSPESEDRWSYFKSADIDIRELKSLQATSAGPLISTTWDQGQYYNEMAPFDANSNTGNNHVWIGCVATAMAQVMKYWEYPKSGTGSKSYNHPDYGTQSADFENTTYNWGSMPDNVTSLNTEVQKISYHAAVAVEMNFGPGSSGAWLNLVVDAFTDYFKYNSTILWVDKNEWDTEAEWKEMLRREIDNGRPVIYSGYNSSLSSGHTFVCDGYSSDDYFHFNWGWGGNANGNFLLSSLTPSDRDYTNNQSAIFGIEPVEATTLTVPYINGFESSVAGEFSLFGNSSVSVAESHTGFYSIQLSSEGFSSKSKNVASITFEVPADCMLDFWVKRYTPQESGYNIQKAVLYSQYGNESLISFFKGDYNDSEWENYYADISAYEGQIVKLMFIQENLDPAKEQWMYVDDVAITGGSTNLPPYKPGSPSPADGAVSVSLSPLLQWTGGDPNGDDVQYWIYFDKSSARTLYSSTYYNYKRLSGLEPKTTYYWMIKALDDEEEYTNSDVWSFTTRGLPPEVESCGVVSLTSTSAVLCAQIVNDNDSEVIRSGVWWDEMPDPQMSDNEVESDSIADIYQVEINGLEPYETYYVKAFAQSEEGYGIGDEFKIRTEADAPDIFFVKIDDIKRNSAVVTGFVSDINDSLITKRGVFWSVYDGFNVDSAAVNCENGSWNSTGEFELLVDSMPGPDTIYFRVFAENSAGLTYTSQDYFVTQNQYPVIDLDADNSSGRNGLNYEFSLVEQNEGGKIADTDVEISDADGDIIQQIIVTIEKQVNDDKEYLVYTGDSTRVSVFGDLSDSLVVEYDGAKSNLFWDSIINYIEYRNISNAPVADSLREINVLVNDGFSYSLGAVTFVSVIPENDAPVSIESPSLSEVPRFNSYVSGVEQGIWIDSLDGIYEAEFKYNYEWEANLGDTIIVVETTGDFLFIDSTLCGSSLRVVETVIDKNSGGDNEATARAYSEWYDVRKIEQKVIDFNLVENQDIIPKVEYREAPYRFTGSATSGLPLQYGTFKDEFFEISNDSLFVKNIGMEPVYAFQSGNSCYLEADRVYKNINVVKGNQQIINAPDSIKMFYNDSIFDLTATTSSNLELNYEVKGNDVLEFQNQRFIIIGTGAANIIINQAGNDKWNSVSDTIVCIVEKGVQEIRFDSLESVAYDDKMLLLEAESSSGLNVSFDVSDNEIADIQGDTLLIKTAGTLLVFAYQDGNDLWMPADPVYRKIIIQKADQVISTTLPDSITTRHNISCNNFVASSGLTLFNIESSNEEIIQVLEDSIIVNGRGDVLLKVEQPGNENYHPVDTAFSFNVSYPLNVEKFEKVTFDLFPNPANDKLHLVIDGDVELPLDFSLLNVLGQVQMTKKISKQFQVVDIENIDSGTYIVLLRNDDHYLTRKIIVK